MSDNLLEEVVVEILALLPVKSLLRFSTVSKDWCSLISSHSFKAHHLSKTPTRKGDLSLFRFYIGYADLVGKERFLLYPDDIFPHCYKDDLACIPCCYVDEFDCPFKSVNRYLNIVGSCNGVLCLTDDVDCYTGWFALWNPSIRKLVSIPKPSITFSNIGPYAHSLGFGFDSTSDDYKVVRVVYLESQHYDFDVVPPLVEVYSLRQRCWKRVPSDLNYVILERSPSAFLNGACHWLAHNPQRTQFVVLSFALGDECFREIPIPDLLVQEYAGEYDGWLNYKRMTVAGFDGSLYLVPYKTTYGSDFGSMWMMREYGCASSWAKIFNNESADEIQRLVAFRRNGEFLFVGAAGPERELVSYNPKTKQRWYFKIGGYVGSYYLNTYLESLILLGEADLVSVADYAAFNEGTLSFQQLSSSNATAEKEKEEEEEPEGKMNLENPTSSH